MMKEKLPWIITAVLAAVLIIVTFLWLDAVSKLDNGNLSAQRDLIREYCSANDEESRARCQTEIEDMTRMLMNFNKEQTQNIDAQVELQTEGVEVGQ